MKYRINIIETNVWSTDVDANNKYEAINKAENNHAKKPTFEFYNDEYHLDLNIFHLEKN